MQRITFGRLALWASLGILLLGLPALAQNTAGTIVGHVSDPTGAAVPDARVVVTNVDTKDTRSGSTNANGDFAFPLLKPGNYEVQVTRSGFKSFTDNSLVLNVDQTVRADATLTVGSTTETVNVNTTALALDTDTSSLNQVINSKQILDLPLNGRNFQDLLFLTPGAVNEPGGEQSSYRIIISGDNASSISLGGARGSSNGYTLDGTTILDIGYDTPAFAPSLDSIDEFKAQTKGYSAAYGYSAAQVNLSSKAGTNDYHGTVFEFIRNNAVDATPHGSTPGVTIPLLQRNQFGYALGGPVIIPHLYNGKNKTFFFANYEGFRQNTGGGSTALIPTTDELQGIFSPAVLGVFTAANATTQCGVTYHAGDPHPLFDPQTGCPLPLTNGNYVIPTNRISRLGQLAQRPGLYFPSAPNLSVPLGQPNYAVNSATSLTFDQQNYRIDQNIGSKDSIFFHAVVHNEFQTSGAMTPVSGQVSKQPARLYTLTETHIFTPQLTNQLRIGYLEALYKQEPAQAITSADLSFLAFPNSFTETSEGYPRLEFDSSPLNNGLVYAGAAFFNTPSFSDQPVWDFGESGIWNRGRHTISFGFGFRKIHLDLQNGGGLGRVNFNGQYSGDAFADLLFGATSTLGLTQVAPLTDPKTGPTPHLVFSDYSPYIQDDWKVNSNLTLNLGLRYEFTPTPYEEQNFFIWPNFSAPGGAIYVANKTIVNNYAGTNPFGAGGLYLSPPNGERGPGPARKTDFAPRVGFAFRPPFANGKLVVRGAYGIFYDTIEANEYQASTNFYPLSSNITTNTIPLTYPPTYNTDSLPTASVAGPITSYATDPSSSLGFLQIQPVKTYSPYFQSWNFGIQREAGKNTVVSVDYSANKGTHLFSRYNPNAPTQCIAVNGCTVTFTSPATVPVKERTPYQNLGTLVYAGFDGYSNYNAMDIKLEHRSKDLTTLVAYTWSKALDVKSAVAGFSNDNNGWAGPQDSSDLRADYGRSSFDVGQRLAISAVYNLPIGRGKALLGGSSRALDAVVGGWSLGTISSLQGGLPFTVGAEDVQGANNTYAERADLNLAHPPAGFVKNHQHYYSFSTTPLDPGAQYTQPRPGYFGTSQRNSLSGPGQINFDLSAFKNFRIFESVGFQFRVDAFNVLNHWNPGQPDANIFDSTAGQILPTNSQTSARVLQASARISF